MKLIDYQELTAAPWKNGGGVTRELACFPAGATFDDFLWRVSIADVGASGPFSLFPGVERVITLLDGDGMLLEFAEGRSHALTAALSPYRFRGEDRLHAQLVGGACKDFNLMLRHDVVAGAVEVFRDASTLHCAAGSLLFFCAAGQWEITRQDGMRHEVKLLQTLVGACTEDSFALRPLQSDSALICVRVTSITGTTS